MNILFVSLCECSLNEGFDKNKQLGTVAYTCRLRTQEQKTNKTQQRRVAAGWMPVYILTFWISWDWIARPSLKKLNNEPIREKEEERARKRNLLLTMQIF